MNTELIRLKTISETIGLSTATLRRMIKRNELRGVLLGGNYYLSHKDYDELLFNIECKKLNVTPDEMREIYKETQKEKHKELFKLMGLDKLDKTMQDYILKSIS